MKVKELIELLGRVDPENKVFVEVKTPINLLWGTPVVVSDATDEGDVTYIYGRIETRK